MPDREQWPGEGVLSLGTPEQIDEFLAAVEQEIDTAKREAEERTRQYLDLVWRSMMLAPTIEICEALIRGETVPLDRLDQDWVRRFGLRT